jgi:hypothetical protein
MRTVAAASGRVDPMASTEEKLFRILKVANSKNFQSRIAIAREVADRRASEFAYVFKGATHHCSPEAIVQYVSLAHALGLLSDDQRPFADMKGALLPGFKLTISDKIKDLARREKFDPAILADTVRKMIRRNPAQVPSLRNLYKELDLKCDLRRSDVWCSWTRLGKKPRLIPVFAKLC